MTDHQRIAVIAKNLAKYSGPWAGDIHWMVNEFVTMANREAELRAACEPLRECEGDLASVHVPHPVFATFKSRVWA